MLKLGIIGHPLHHTLSPQLHTFLLQQLGLEGQYQAYPTPPESLAAQLCFFRLQGFRGFNVTIPHKVSILDYLQEVSETAQLVQAVNTVTIENDHLRGDNTDISGFRRSLPAEVQETLAQRSVLILGAGGAARAVLVALLQAQAPRITILARSVQKAQDLMSLATNAKTQLASCSEVSFLPWQELADLAPYSLVINTTPIGMAREGIAAPTEMPLSLAQLKTLPKRAFVYDLIYCPLETALIQQAKALGHPVMGGLEMLVYQGIEAFEIWTGARVSADRAATALRHIHQFLDTIDS